MPVKIYCDDCGEEIFQEIDDYFTLREIRQRCLCTDCHLKRMKIALGDSMKEVE